jgi:ferritin-like metal-binding protein YciE
MASSSDAAREIFVTGLRNTHGLELQALQIMNRQVERLENYPEVEQGLRRHIQ